VSTEPEPMSAKMTAFCAPDVLEIFDAIVAPQQIWQEDPYDVESIHAEARETFARLLNRATADEPTDRGRSFLLMGESGSGKTHLMRAFRSMAHQRGDAYFGYLQLTTAASNYGSYVLQNLIKSLDMPYFPPQVNETGLMRLSTAVFDLLPGMTPDAAERFRHGDVPDVATEVFELAERFDFGRKFAGCDEDLIRAMLFLQRDDFKIRSRVMKWLRCEDLSDYDCKFLGGLVPRPKPEQATAMITAIGRLVRVVQNAAIIICLDQLEDVFKQSDADLQFSSIVNLLVALADEMPNGIILLSCLEDFYAANRNKLIKAKLDRIEVNPPPIRLSSVRRTPDICAMVARRVARLYDESGLIVEDGSTYPFTEQHLRIVDRLNTRKVLEWCRHHHQKCVAGGRWEEPRPGEITTSGDLPDMQWDQAWNDATSLHVAVPEGEEELVPLLTRAIGRCNDEIAADHKLTAVVSGNVILVDESSPSGVRQVAIAICEKRAVGDGLRKQVVGAAALAAGRPLVLVRSTPFPTNPKTMVAIEIGKAMGAAGRRVEVANADWRAMAGFETFFDTHNARPGFADWQRAARPLSQLRSMQLILDLKPLAEKRVRIDPPVEPAGRPPEKPAAMTAPPGPKPAGMPVPAVCPEVKIGVSRELISAPVFILPDEIKRHMAFIGGSGSGKSTVALRIIEHLLARGVSAVLIDRKGDLSRYADPAAWDVDADPAHPTHPVRRKWLREHLDVDLYTPGSGDKGRPLSLPLVPDDLAELSTTDREEVARFAAESLGGMMQLNQKKEGDRIMLAILAKAIEVLASTPGVKMSVTLLRGLIGSMDPTLLNAVGGYDVKHYKRLADSMLTLDLNHARLLSSTDGDRLDVNRLLGRSTTPGRVRLTVINTQSLADQAVDFWLSQFLLSVLRWQARHPSPTLQSVIFLDEADLYLPATRQPATKAPLESLLKRARSAGLGILLATQSPGDLDYKCRDNIRSWLIGLVKESVAINKLRSMFASSPIDPADRLPGQKVGEFFYLRDGQVTPVKAGISLMRTEQLPIEQILKLASERPKLDRR
jgi:GTPase SAR1 family protein